MKNSRQPHLSKQNFPTFFERKFFTPILSYLIQPQRISWEINIKTSLTKATLLDTFNKVHIVNRHHHQKSILYFLSQKAENYRLHFQAKSFRKPNM